MAHGVLITSGSHNSEAEEDLKRTLFTLALAVLGSTLPALASPVTVTLTGVGGKSQGGVYVAPYYLSYGGSTHAVVCDDFSHEVWIGESWTANIYSFSQLGSVTTRFSSIKDYEEAAFLDMALFADPKAAGNINFAIWALFTPSTKSSKGWDSGAAWWLSQANTWYKDGAKGVDFADFEIITPTNLNGKDSPQEYLLYCPSPCPPPTPTPEPSSLLLLGTGLASLGTLGRRRLAAKSDSRS